MTEPTATATAPATLSGRPIIEVADEVPGPRIGRGTVVTAVLLSSLVLAGVVLVLLNRGPDGTDVRRMSAGDCYVETDVVTEGGRPVPYGSDAPCLSSAPRVVAVVVLPLGPYPGADGLNRVVADRCGGEQDLIVAPTSETWSDGDRTLACIDLP